MTTAGRRTAFVTGGSGFIGGALVRRLISEGWRVRALARSDRSAAALAKAGAEPIAGDLDAVDALQAGAEGCSVAFHCAAYVGDWGPRADFERVNVQGTDNVLDACRASGVTRLVHVSSDAAVLAGQPLRGVDETAPLRPNSKSPYCSTKARSEQLVREANGDGIETVVVRPRMVWGPGDTTVVRGLVDAVENGRFAWLGGGHQRISTTHVDNAVEALMLAADAGRPGEAYFVADGESVEFRDFVSRLLATQGVDPPNREVPAALPRLMAPVLERIWRTLRLKGEPPLNRMAVWICSLESTLDISKAQAELGYGPVVSIDDGLRALEAPATMPAAA
jgi:nucleoside-diphosphate-sugar epimerase